MGDGKRVFLFAEEAVRFSVTKLLLDSRFQIVGVRVVKDLGILRWPDVSIWPTEGPVSRVKWGDGSGYNSEEFLAAIFTVDPTNPMADDLFTALGHETEWISFFQGYAHSR